MVRVPFQVNALRMPGTNSRALISAMIGSGKVVGDTLALTLPTREGVHLTSRFREALLAKDAFA
jgi:hypothetical protein